MEGTLSLAPASLPFNLAGLPSDVRRELVRAVTDVLALEPLPTTPQNDWHHGHRALPDHLPRIVAVYGGKRTGKTSFADFLQRRYAGVHQLGFSVPMIVEANEYLAPYGHVVDDVNKADLRYRYLIQMWATARRAEDPHYWIGPLESEIERALGEGARLVLLPGIRDPLEWDAIERSGGEIWKVVNPNVAEDDSPTSSHPIEHALDHKRDDEFTRLIVNDARSLLGWCRIAAAEIEASPAGV
jgi:hypothetical protein